MRFGARGPSEKPKGPRAGASRGLHPLPMLLLPFALAAEPLPVLGEEAAGTWLVLLGSKRDPAEAIPGLAVIAAHPEIGARPATLSSSRFKNLMPCYTVTVAGALPDKGAALSLAARLRAAGVDNYVKAAGEWVGPSAALDAWCSSAGDPAATPVSFLRVAGGELWAPVAGLPDDVAARMIIGKPAAISPRYDAWRQPVTGPPPGALPTLQAASVETGRTATCTVLDYAALTLGTPHFGMLQEGPLTAPACGSPRIFARLSCPGVVTDGAWVVSPTAVTPYTPAGTGTSRQRDDARALLDKLDAWKDAPGEHTVDVTLWKGPQGTLALVAGRAEDGGVCGGSDTTWFAVFTTSGSRLGQPLGELTAADYVTVLGLVDTDADGRPEVALGSFPDDLRLVDPAGATTGELTVDFCDCPC